MQKPLLIFWIMCAFLLLCVNVCRAVDRCLDYKVEVRNAVILFSGQDYPWWYHLGQLSQESRCRSNVTAFDGGQGISQMMPASAREINKEMKENNNPYIASQGIRMQAYYMSKLDKMNKDGRLFLSYMNYNSGPGMVRKEYDRAKEKTWLSMRDGCRRKVLTLSNGSKLDLCDVGYGYPCKIYKYGQSYKLGVDKRRFW